MMQKSRNTYIQIKQNIFALKALFYIKQLNIFAASRNCIFYNFKEMIYLLTVKEIKIHSKNIYLFTKSIIIRGNCILTQNYIHFKEPYQFAQGNISSFNENIFIQGNYIHSRKYVQLRNIYSFKFKAICSFKETVFIEHCCIHGIAEIFIQNCPQSLCDNYKLYNYYLLNKV